MSFQSDEGVRQATVREPLIVVSGLPRSGTSMLMQMLHAGGIPVLCDTLRAPDVSNPRGYYELERVKRLHREADKSWLADGEGKAIKVISFFLASLPDIYTYQVIFMQRSVREILASQNRMLDDLAQERGKANDDRLLESYEDHLFSVQTLLASRPWFATLHVNYRDVIAQPVKEAVRIARFLGRDLDTSRMASVVEARLYHNRCD